MPTGEESGLESEWLRVLRPQGRVAITLRRRLVGSGRDTTASYDDYWEYAKELEATGFTKVTVASYWSLKMAYFGEHFVITAEKSL